MKALVSLAALALASTIGLTAHAQGVDELGPYGGLERRAARSQRFAFEVRVGPYTPRVDEALDSNPYEETFGTSQRWFAGFEVDWQVLRIERVLSFGPGFSFGYTKSNGKGFLVSTGERSAQATSLTILPMDLVGVLRVDALADNTPIPIVPYAKLGLGYALWWSVDGDQVAEDDAANGARGEDMSYGYTWALGAMLRLDFLDVDEAATTRASSGIDHSYAFIEWHSSHLDAFGSNETMDVGNDAIVFGLALEAFM